MPFQPGNKLGQKGRAFDGALRRAIAQDDGKRLRQAAETLLTKAADGEPWALQMLADRLDGKAAQTVDVSVSKAPEEMTLAELISEVAAVTGRGAEALEGAEQPSGLH